MRPKVNSPLYDTGWRVGMPVHISNGGNEVHAKPVHITAIDGTNHLVFLRGYGKPEWTTVDR